MDTINAVRIFRRKRSTLVSEPQKKTWIELLLHPLGLLTSVIGPAFLVCFATGSFLVFAALLFHDAVGALLGVMLYQNIKHSLVTVVPLIQGGATPAPQYQSAA